MDHTRKIEQINTINQIVPGLEDTTENQLVVVARCNDGTVWMTYPDASRPYWRQLPDMPQPEGDFQ